MRQDEYFKQIIYRNVIPGMYSVSQYGTIINNYTNSILSPWTAGNGDYFYIGLRTTDNTDLKIRLHVLVATMFVPKTEEDILLERNCVEFKDRNKYNIYCNNLKWVTKQENINNIKRTEALRNPLIMESKSGVRLTEEKVRCICECLSKGIPYKDICHIVGLEGTDNDVRLIRYIYRRDKWTNISKDYIFKDYTPVNFKGNDDMVIKICNILENNINNLSNSQIAIAVGLKGDKNDSSFISDIATGKTWTHISNNYTFTKNKRVSSNRRINEDIVIKICEMLQNTNLIYKDIAIAVGLTGDNNDTNIINKIKNRRQWTNISKYYNFNNR